MKYGFIISVLIVLMLGIKPSYAQQKTDNICYINNGRIYFNLDKRWSAEKKKSISTLFNLDSLLIEKALKGQSPFTYDNITWEVTRLDANIYELSKQVEGGNAGANPADVFLLDDAFFVKPSLIPPIFAPAKRLGLNEFKKEPTVTYKNGVAHFFIAGYQSAQRIYLSGTFNNWSTMQSPMRRTNNGWETSLTLAPGEYQYKFIVDGKWITDPQNKQKRPDGRAGFNSVFYCYNYVFKLDGYTTAKSVILSGSFNNWTKNKPYMERSPGGWRLPVYLPEGTYAYKFIVDGKWMNDPANKTMRADASGNLNSFMGIGDTLMFRLKGFTNAKKVVLTGSFNNWNGNELVMNKTASGWELPYILGAGNYEYKFIVDGRWIPDPGNPNTSGSGDYTNSCISFKPNHTFRLSGFNDAKNVLVSGSFNNWNKEGYKMVKKGNSWTYSLYLAPGKYTYKFLVDGQWLLDPGNELWEENQTGTGNSVLWIETR